jgi:WD40 repeat protein
VCLCGLCFLRAYFACLTHTPNSLVVWDLGEEARVEKLDGHTSWVSSVSFLSDSIVVSSGSDLSLRAWDLNIARPMTKAARG